MPLRFVSAAPHRGIIRSHMDDRHLSIINDCQLVSVMNKTKWRELCTEFEALHSLSVSVRYKLITSDEIFGFSPVWWDELFEQNRTIEWLDFDPIVKEHRGRLISDMEADRTKEILGVFHKHCIRYSIQESYFRVWGYFSQSEQPTFV